MAETAQSLINRALRQLGALSQGEVPTAQEASDGLMALNQMVHSWRTSGVDLGWVDVTLTQALPVDDAHLSGMSALLAIEIAPEYGYEEIPQATIALAREGWEGLINRSVADNADQLDMRMPDGLQRMPSQYNRGAGRN